MTVQPYSPRTYDTEGAPCKKERKSEGDRLETYEKRGPGADTNMNAECIKQIHMKKKTSSMGFFARH